MAVLIFHTPRETVSLTYEALASMTVMGREAQRAGIRTEYLKEKDNNFGFWTLDMAIDYCIDHDFSHIFMGADDVKFPPQTLVTLVSDNKDVVGGVYPKRNLDPIIPAVQVRDESKFDDYLETGALVEVDYVSAHSMLIKRSVLEKMIKDYPELHHFSEDGKEHCSLFFPMIENQGTPKARVLMDDWSFSVRARKSGFSLWLDFSVQGKHLLPATYVGFPKSKK